MAKINRSESAPVANLEAIQNEINLMMNVADIETRLAADPRNQRFGELADAYLAQGEIDEAIQICQEGIKHFPHYGTVLLILAKAYQQKGDRIQASAQLQEYLNTHPSSIAAHRMMGDFALDEKNIRKALKHFRIALRLDPVNRNLIQQFVEVRDEFQKVKDTVPADEDELDDAKPVIKRKTTPEIKPVKTIERVLDEVLEMPESLKEPEISVQEKTELMEESAAEPFTFDSEPVVEPVLDKEPEGLKEKFIQESPKPFVDEFITRDTQDLLPDDEIEPIKPVRKELPAEAEGMNPVYVDENGVMYFYDDDEVSFDQYKKRYDLQKVGKAKIMNRARLDERLALLGIAEPANTAEINFEETLSEREDIAESLITEPITEKIPETAETGVAGDTFDVLSASGEDEESVEEETAFEDMEISYRDYMDILTEESDLIEAMMGDAPQEPVTEEIATDLINKIVGVSEPEAEQVQDITEGQMSYSDYYLSLTDKTDIQDADLIEISQEDQDESERIISMAEFARELDLSDELIDFQTYRLFSPTETDYFFSDEISETKQESDTAINYQDYFNSLVSDTDINEADLTESAAASIETILEPADQDQHEIISPVSEKTEALTAESVKPITAAEAESVKETFTDVKEKQTVSVEGLEHKVEESPVEEAVVAEQTIRAETITATKEMISAETDEQTEETAAVGEFEEDIDPREASLELVDQLALFGQFGTAYKVCKMLKLKNPTDAKVDRKILELKRLYLWSSQYVG